MHTILRTAQTPQPRLGGAFSYFHFLAVISQRARLRCTPDLRLHLPIVPQRAVWARVECGGFVLISHYPWWQIDKGWPELLWMRLMIDNHMRRVSLPDNPPKPVLYAYRKRIQ